MSANFLGSSEFQRKKPSRLDHESNICLQNFLLQNGITVNLILLIDKLIKCMRNFLTVLIVWSSSSFSSSDSEPLVPWRKLQLILLVAAFQWKRKSAKSLLTLEAIFSLYSLSGKHVNCGGVFWAALVAFILSRKHDICFQFKNIWKPWIKN